MNKGYWALCEIESSLIHKVEELLREKNRRNSLAEQEIEHLKKQMENSEA